MEGFDVQKESTNIGYEIMLLFPLYLSTEATRNLKRNNKHVPHIHFSCMTKEKKKTVTFN
jgi:hypothetical protein